MRRLAAFLLMIALLGAVSVPVAGQTRSTTEELLPGMVTEEVEPGVFRVVNDGVRELHFGERDLDDNLRIVVGHDGGPWFVSRDRFFRLGDDVTHDFREERRHRQREFEVAPDGTIWTVERAGELGRWTKEEMTVLRSFDGERWRLHKRNAFDVAVAPDGSVWAAWSAKRKPNQVTVGRFTGEGWERLPNVYWGHDLYVSGDGDVWLATWDWPADDEAVNANAPDIDPAFGEGIVLNRFARDRWQPEATVNQEDESGFWFGGDGVVRLRTRAGEHLRFDGSGWAPWTPPARSAAWGDGWPEWPDGHAFAPDGSLWARWMIPNPEQGPWEPEALCDGVARLEGGAIDHYLAGYCIPIMAFGLDGSAWLVGRELVWPPTDEGSRDLRPYELHVVIPSAED